MAGLFSSGEQDMLGNIVQQRQQANQALGSQYGKYGGIVQAGAALADVGADAITGGRIGSSDPRMQQVQEVKSIFSQVASEVGSSTSSTFYEKLSQALATKYPEQAQKAAEEAVKVKKDEAELAKTQAITAKTEAETVSRTELIKSREETLREKFPKLTDAEVKSIASNDTSFNAYIKPPKDYTPSEYGKMLIEAGYDPDSETYKKKMETYAEAKAKPAGDDAATLLLKNEARRLEIELAKQKLEAGKGKEENARRAAKFRMLTSEYNTKQMVSRVDDASKLVTNITAGWGGLLKDLPASKARTLKARLDTLKARIGFDTLQAMRDASPTGGALGQVSERELGFLQATIANLDQLQDPEELKAELEKVKEHYLNFLDYQKRSEDSKEPLFGTEEWEKWNSQQKSSTPSPAPAAPTAAPSAAPAAGGGWSIKKKVK